MSTARHEDRGLPRIRRAVAPRPGGSSREESWPGANEAKAEELGVRSLTRLAGAEGLQLRHSDYGYALVDSAHRPVNGNSMTLAEVKSWLGRA